MPPHWPGLWPIQGRADFIRSTKGCCVDQSEMPFSPMASAGAPLGRAPRGGRFAATRIGSSRGATAGDGAISGAPEGGGATSASSDPETLRQITSRSTG